MKREVKVKAPSSQAGLDKLKIEKNHESENSIVEGEGKRETNSLAVAKNAKMFDKDVKNGAKTAKSGAGIDNDEFELKTARREKNKRNVGIALLAACVIITAAAYFFAGPIYPLQVCMYVEAYLLVGYDVLLGAIKNIFRGKMLDEKFLMSIATIGALALGDFVEAIAVMVLYSVGEMLQDAAVDRSKARIKSLISLKSKYATVLVEGKEEQTLLADVKVGDTILIKPGDKVPLDCVVNEGSSYINTSAITGESVELCATIGTELLSGYINMNGALTCMVTKLEKDSTVTQIINMVEKATKTKANSEKFITRFSRWYTPIVVGLAVLLTLVPTICGLPFHTWFYRSLTFLVVSCPCALVISVPLSYFAGLGASARNGILIKGTQYLEALAKAKTVIFDKTGTLTKGNFKVENVRGFGMEPAEVLEFVAYAESLSQHKIARAVVQSYGQAVDLAKITSYSEIAGKGINATIFGKPCLVGNAELLKDSGIEVDEAQGAATVVYLAISGKLCGYVALADEVKEDSLMAIERLKEAGVKSVCMFTGDNEQVAASVAEKLKLDGFYANLSPAGKVETLKRLQEGKSSVTFVGDGINDAPILANVDVGISMGARGSDIAIETSDVVLMTDEPAKVVDAIKIAQKTNRIVYENLFFILLVKAVVLLMGAFGIAGMWLAIFADVGVSLITILWSLRAMTYGGRKKSPKRVA